MKPDDSIRKPLQEIAAKAEGAASNFMHINEEMRQNREETNQQFHSALEAQIETPKKLENLKEVITSKQEREQEHTLWRYWCLADWGERFGIFFFLFGVFMVGYLSASNHLISRIISLIRDIKP